MLGRISVCAKINKETLAFYSCIKTDSKRNQKRALNTSYWYFLCKPSNKTPSGKRIHHSILAACYLHQIERWCLNFTYKRDEFTTILFRARPRLWRGHRREHHSEVFPSHFLSIYRFFLWIIQKWLVMLNSIRSICMDKFCILCSKQILDTGCHKFKRKY